jgi:hypothetical protein
MDWLTKDYIKAEAAKGRKQAIECTRLHWQQLVKAGPKKLRKACDNDLARIDSDLCAMCARYFVSGRDKPGKCLTCPLNCWKLWWKASDSHYEWYDEIDTRTNWRKWKQAAKAMLAKIDRLYERLYG